MWLCGFGSPVDEVLHSDLQLQSSPPDLGPCLAEHPPDAGENVLGPSGPQPVPTGGPAEGGRLAGCTDSALLSRLVDSTAVPMIPVQKADLLLDSKADFNQRENFPESKDLLSVLELLKVEMS